MVVWESYSFEEGGVNWSLVRPMVDMTLTLDLYGSNVAELMRVYDIVAIIPGPLEEIKLIAHQIIYLLKHDNLHDRRKLLELSMIIFNKLKKIGGGHNELVLIADNFNALKTNKSSPPEAPRTTPITFIKKFKR